MLMLAMVLEMSLIWPMTLAISGGKPGKVGAEGESWPSRDFKAEIKTKKVSRAFMTENKKEGRCFSNIAPVRVKTN